MAACLKLKRGGEMRAYLIFIMLLAGCGGGDDGKTQIANNAVFSLNNYNSDAPGNVISIDLTATDSDGFNYTGSLRAVNRGKIMDDGIQVTNREIILSFSENSNPDLYDFSEASQYIDENGYLIKLIYSTDGVICTPVYLDKLPDSVRVDDFGNMPDLNCDDGTTEELGWWVEPNGINVDLVFNTKKLDVDGSTVVLITEILTLNQAGDFLDYKQTVLYSNGYTINIQSR